MMQISESREIYSSNKRFTCLYLECKTYSDSGDNKSFFSRFGEKLKNGALI